MTAPDPGPTTPWLTVGDVRARRPSYAQNFEDIRLARALPGPAGFYIDVGANEPVYHSVTKRFYDLGWSGVNVEPQPALHRRLCADRPRDVNLLAGLADRAGTLVFYEAPGQPGLSSFDPAVGALLRSRGERVVERAVEVLTLAELCDRHAGGRPIAFLKLDAEGFERPILDGGDWSRWRPRVVVVEASDPSACAAWSAASGYEFAVFDGINQLYVRGEDRCLIPPLAAPVSEADGVIPYTYARLVEELHARADAGHGPLALARRLRRLARRAPWVYH